MKDGTKLRLEFSLHVEYWEDNLQATKKQNSIIFKGVVEKLAHLKRISENYSL